MMPKHGITVLLLGAEDEENLALRYIGACLRQHGHNPVILPFGGPDEIPAILRAVREHKPHIIALSIAFQCRANGHFDLVERVRAAGYAGHIVAGGHFPTFEYAKLLSTQKGIDSVGRFEGEETLVRLAEHIPGDGDLSHVPNLVYRTAHGVVENPCTTRFPDLDELPFPLRTRRAQVRLGEKFASLVASRGCWHASCLYCCIGAFHRDKTQRFALRSAESVAREIGMLYRDKGIRLFQFHDDNFVLRTCEETGRRVQALGAALRREGVDVDRTAFLIKARPDVVDVAVGRALAELGCVGVFLGIENASSTGLRALIRGTEIEAVQRAPGILAAHGMVVTYNLLIFHPRATMREIDQNIAFARQHLALPFDFGRAEIVAGSPLARQVEARGMRRGEWPHWDYVMAEEDVQRLFAVNRRTFRRQGSPYPTLMHSLIALAYHAFTLKRLHPGPVADSLAAACMDLIARSNTFVLDCLEHMRDLAGQNVPPEAVDTLDRRLTDGCRTFLAECFRLSDRMTRLQIAGRVFQAFGVKPVLQRHPLLCKALGTQPLGGPGRKERA
ncbi:MAG: cobalamin-dependent protein [Kiritimatiellae bacterium]|nr:cobalamin-dependent protein [Kiritimatiellia bacterium]